MDQATGDPTQPSPLELFSAVLEATDGTTQRVASSREAAAAIAAAAAEQGERGVLYEPADVVEDLGLRLPLAAHGVELVPVDRAGNRAGEFKVGLTGAEMAIAETGTLVVGGRPGGWGLAAALPWVHIVVLRADAVVPDLATAYEAFESRLQSGERDWVWITGPSRTADIGHTLVLGAHGPNSLSVLE